ncbi:hypothetical protein [Planktothricoides sp. SR001]|uniref:hypothetical protein n=1 Tax=Planktothricoides sp. SR001 TaxID=1705388 RepID=UPI0012E22D95|nr:hypothetical protein [Planktothricoides sp. SR001]
MELRNRVSSLGATVNSNIPKRNPVSWLGSKNRSPPKTAIAHQNNCLGLRNRVSFFGATVNSNIPKRNPVSCLGVKTRSRSVPEGIAPKKAIAPQKSDRPYKKRSHIKKAIAICWYVLVGFPGVNPTYRLQAIAVVARRLG